MSDTNEEVMKRDIPHTSKDGIYWRQYSVNMEREDISVQYISR